MGLLSTAKRLIGSGYERLEDAVRGAAGSLLLGVPAAQLWAQSPTLRRAFASPADLATAAIGLINAELGRLSSPGLHVAQLAGEVLASGAGPGVAAAENAATAPTAPLARALMNTGKLAEWLQDTPALARHTAGAVGDIADLLAQRVRTGKALEGVPAEVAADVDRLLAHPDVAALVKRYVPRPKQAALEAGGGAAGVMVAPQLIDTVGGWLGWWGNGHAGGAGVPRPVATAVTGGTTSSATPAGTPAVSTAGGGVEAPPSPVDTASPRAVADTAASPSPGGTGGHVVGVPSFAMPSPTPAGGTGDVPPLFPSRPTSADFTRLAGVMDAATRQNAMAVQQFWTEVSRRAAAQAAQFGTTPQPWPDMASSPAKPDWLRAAEAQARRLLQSGVP